MLKTRAEQLIATAKQFLDALINSLPRLPYGLRWICKQIQQIAGENFPQSTQSGIMYLVWLQCRDFDNPRYSSCDWLSGLLPFHQLDDCYPHGVQGSGR